MSLWDSGSAPWCWGPALSQKIPSKPVLSACRLCPPQLQLHHTAEIFIIPCVYIIYRATQFAWLSLIPCLLLCPSKPRSLSSDIPVLFCISGSCQLSCAKESWNEGLNGAESSFKEGLEHKHEYNFRWKGSKEGDRLPYILGSGLTSSTSRKHADRRQRRGGIFRKKCKSRAQAPMEKKQIMLWWWWRLIPAGKTTSLISAKDMPDSERSSWRAEVMPGNCRKAN